MWKSLVSKFQHQLKEANHAIDNFEANHKFIEEINCDPCFEREIELGETELNLMTQLLAFYCEQCRYRSLSQMANDCMIMSSQLQAFTIHVTYLTSFGFVAASFEVNPAVHRLDNLIDCIKTLLHEEFVPSPAQTNAQRVWDFDFNNLIRWKENENDSMDDYACCVRTMVPPTTLLDTKNSQKVKITVYCQGENMREVNTEKRLNEIFNNSSYPLILDCVQSDCFQPTATVSPYLEVLLKP